MVIISKTRATLQCIPKTIGNFPELGLGCRRKSPLTSAGGRKRFQSGGCWKILLYSLIQRKTPKITGCFMTTAFFNSLLFDCIRPPASVKGLRFAPMNDSFLPPKAGTILNYLRNSGGDSEQPLPAIFYVRRMSYLPAADNPFA